MKPIFALGAFVLSLAIHGLVQAEPQQGTTATLYAAATAGGTIAANESEVQRTLTVDTSRKVSFLITSPTDCDVVIDLPDGTRLAPDAGTDDRRRWLRFTVAPGDNRPLMPGVGPGYNSLVTVASAPIGRYQVRVSRAGAGFEPVPFLITLLQDSDVRMGLVLPSRDALMGAPFLVAALLFDDDQPLQDASVMMTVTPQPAGRRRPRTRASEQALPDDGAGVDAAQGDGIYTSTLTPAVPGRFLVAVRATGLTGARIPYERHAGFAIDASEPTVQIGGVQGSQWRKDRAGMINRLSVPLLIEGRPGVYDILLTVAASNGNRVNTRHMVEVGGSGAVRATVSVEGAQFRILGVDGPYILESVDAFEVGDDSRILRARRTGTDTTPPVELRAIAAD